MNFFAYFLDKFLIGDHFKKAVFELLSNKNLKICIPFFLFLCLGSVSAQKFVGDFEVTHFKLPIETSTNAILEDSYGFVWISSTNGLWRYDGSTYKNYIKNENDHTSITDNHISYLYEDQQKTLWIGTYGGGLLKYDRNCDCFQRFIHNEQNPKSLSFNEIKVIYETRDNDFYVGTDGGGLNLMDRSTNTFKSYQYSATDSLTISHNNVLALEEDTEGNLFVGTWKGLNIFNKDTQKVRRIFNDTPKESQNHFELAFFNGKLITTYNGGSIYEAENNFSRINLSNNWLSRVKKENNGICWFTSGDRVHITDPNFDVLQTLDLGNLFYPEGDFALNNIYHKKNKNVTWVLDASGNFFLIEKKTTAFKPFAKEVTQASVAKTSINYWFTQGDNIFIFNSENGELKRLQTKFSGRPIVATNQNQNVWVVDPKNYYQFSPMGDLVQQKPRKSMPSAALLSNKGELWVGEILGVTHYLPDSDKMIHFECDPNIPSGIGYFHHASIIFEDSKGDIWIGTQGDGLKKYNPDRNEFVHYRHKIGDKSTVSNNFVNEIFEDNKNTLWIGTSAGLCKLDHTANTFTQIENPLIKDKIINSIEQDSQGNFWVGTLNGLVKYNEANNEVRILNEQDGLLSHKILSSSLALDSGELIFSTNKGTMIFDPEKVKASSVESPLYISKLWVNNELVKPHSKYITKNIEVEERIELNYDDRKFEFEFQVINYNNNGRCKFAYKLDGYDEDWTQAHTNQKATYTNIPSGSYSFLVKASNEDGIWSDSTTKIDVLIKPPFWELLWVRVLGSILLLSLFGIMIWLIIKRERTRSKFEIEKQRVLQFEEVAKMKLKFFTNISHELRTPLTLIASPLDKYIREKTKPNNNVLEMMYRNSTRLLELVNQILDFRKLENNQKLHISPQKDLSVFNNINVSSAYWSKEKKINYEYLHPTDFGTLFFDIDIIEKVATNLLSNAFKYTPEGGTIKLSIRLVDVNTDSEGKVTSGDMEINVIDNGIGIPLEYRDKVFERFYQLDENPEFGYSSGIGLALTAELVKLHKGSIHLLDGTEKGCHFRVKIPVGYKNYETENSILTNGLSHIDSSKTLILIVEDNQDIRKYIKDELKEQYQILEATNGKEGLQMAIATLPDIIISDIMMPETDGIQLANQLKSNELTAHIPFLFLTAKTGAENKITGLSTGADDYIQKPFYISEIQLKIKNLLEGRKLLLKKLKKDLANNSEPEYDRQDRYLDKVNSIIDENMEDANFSVDRLSAELGIGRSQLYRKIQAITGKSIIEYINFHKLSTAMNLIKEGDYSLKEISFRVGYNDNRYFSKSFKKEFGNPPSHFLPKK
ncbi:hybrid sensor histidine kinase/response regulator transcription factor [Flagellimonas sp.]|uniref:hybrid sensor histidine kinase/response regulator transcription factor n=1 Tax=Flagellimonas sp. TaxID=2058762 RepID=UPI003BB0E78D